MGRGGGPGGAGLPGGPRARRARGAAAGRARAGKAARAKAKGFGAKAGKAKPARGGPGGEGPSGGAPPGPPAPPPPPPVPVGGFGAEEEGEGLDPGFEARLARAKAAGEQRRAERAEAGTDFLKGAPMGGPARPAVPQPVTPLSTAPRDGSGSGGPSPAVLAGGGVALALTFGLLTLSSDLLFMDAPQKELEQAVDTAEARMARERLSEFETRLLLMPSDANALAGAGKEYVKLQQYDKAVETLEKVKRTADTDVDFYLKLGEAYSKSGQVGKAAALYAEASANTAPRTPVLLTKRLVDALGEAGKSAEAVAALREQRAALAEPGPAGAEAGAGATDPLTGEAVAAPRFSTVRDQNMQPAGEVELDLLLGRAYSAWKGHDLDAEGVYDKLIEGHPEDYRGYTAKAVLLRKQGDEVGADRLFIQARYHAKTPVDRAFVDQAQNAKPAAK